MASLPPSYFVTVVEDTSSNRVIATATLFTEFQFNHLNHMVSLYACLYAWCEKGCICCTTLLCQTL